MFFSLHSITLPAKDWRFHTFRANLTLILFWKIILNIKWREKFPFSLSWTRNSLWANSLQKYRLTTERYYTLKRAMPWLLQILRITQNSYFNLTRCNNDCYLHCKISYTINGSENTNQKTVFKDVSVGACLHFQSLFDQSMFYIGSVHSKKKSFKNVWSKCLKETNASIYSLLKKKLWQFKPALNLC